jgi:hypothetical protein
LGTKLRSTRLILHQSSEEELAKNVDTTQKWDNTTPNGDRIETNRGSIVEIKTQYSGFFFDVSDK